jgi:hypothetical protein
MGRKRIKPRIKKAQEMKDERKFSGDGGRTVVNRYR